MESGTTRGFRGLKVWHAAMQLVEDVYRATESFPKAEDYGLKGQIRRSACSIPSNIAEGSARSTKKDFRAFLRFAVGSLRELETQLEIAKRVGYLGKEAFKNLLAIIDPIARMLTGLMTSIRARNES